MTVNTSPEFMLRQSDGIVLMVKLNYRLKKTGERFTKCNIPACLKMMNDLACDKRPENGVPAILILQNGKLYTLTDVKLSDEELMAAESAILISVWNLV